jgi:hypothetical protein
MDGFLDDPQNQGRAGTTWEPSHEWRLAGGYTKLAGFAVVHHKTTKLLGWATKPRSKTWQGGAATQSGSTAQEG